MHVSNSLEGFTLVFPLHKQIIASWSNLCELKDRGKAFQAIVFLLFSFRGLRCACPRLPTSASRCVLPSRQGFTLHSSLFTYKGLTSLLEASPLFRLYILLHADHLRLSFVEIKHLADGVRTYVESRFDDVELLSVATLGKPKALKHFQRLGVGLHLLQY